MPLQRVISNDSTHTAILSSEGAYTHFKFADQHIRFRTPECLDRYTAVKKWDHGYLVVSAIYKDIGEEEEYIDLLPILKNLHIEPTSFLEQITHVKISYNQYL